MWRFVLFSVLVVVIRASVAGDEGLADRERFEFFDDYLHHAVNQQIQDVTLIMPDDNDNIGDIEESSADDDVSTSAANQADEQWPNHIPETPNLDVLTYFRDVPKRHWSCCLLGKLAGDKGFLCQAQFYADRLLSQNRNRAHNRLMPFNGPRRDMVYGRSLMEHFRRCVSRKEEQFHTCCYAATMERQALNRWRRYVNHLASIGARRRRRHSGN